MSTKRVLGFVVLLAWGGFVALAAAPGGPQKKTPPAKPAGTAAADSLELSPSTSKPALYDPAGRRDPFRDLLGGSETKEKASAEGTDLAIADMRLIGIVKVKGQYYALISGPQGFPYKVKEGDKFADGFVTKITAETVTFRQTMDRGIRLPSPKEVVKEINPEER